VRTGNESDYVILRSTKTPQLMDAKVSKVDPASRVIIATQFHAEHKQGDVLPRRVVAD
jgi:hypothetical protein